MNRKLRKWLSVGLLAAFLVSTGILVWNFFGYGSGEESYADAAALARPADMPRTPVEPETEEAVMEIPAEEPRMAWVPAPVEEDDPWIEELSGMDLMALREVNPDVVAWIRIPDTRIDYPIMQGEDNDYYLNRDWRGNGNIVGSVFLECRNDPNLTDFNTILYAHNMANGTMFHDLHKFNYEAYRGKIPYVYVVTDGGVLRYEVFSTYDAALDSATYGLSFRQTQTRADFLTYTLENSLFDLGVVPDLTDQILTLSTCSGIGYGHRRVVHARLPMIQITQDE